jgi:chromate transport protein ChrA
VGASVVGIIAISGYKLTQKTIGKDLLLWPIFAISMAVTVVTESEMVLLFLAAGVLVWIIRTPPPAPYFKKHGKRPGIVAFVDGVTAAVVGAIAGAVIVLGRRTIFGTGWSPDMPKVLILLATATLLWRFKKLPEPVIVVGAALIGLVAYPFLGRH